MAHTLATNGTNPVKAFRSNAVIGALAWIGIAILLRFELVVLILLLAPLVCVPLGLALLAGGEEPGQVSRLWRFVTFAQPLGGAGLVGAFMIPTGALAASLTVPWLVVTLLVAYLGVQLLINGGARTLTKLCQAAGMLFLAVGGGWTLLARYGARPLDFSDIIVLLTGVHFHYAGFALPVLTGMAGRITPGGTPRAAAVGVMTGVPFVAVGITVGRWAPLVEVGAALWMTCACLLVVALQMHLAFQRSFALRRSLLGLSGLALLAGMLLAAVYAIKSYFGQSWLEVDTMIPWHGSMNAFGFTLPGLLAWTWNQEQ